MHLQTVEIQMRRLLKSRLIRVFTVCFVSSFFLFQKIYNETNKVAVRIYLMSEATWLYPNTAQFVDPLKNYAAST